MLVARLAEGGAHWRQLVYCGGCAGEQAVFAILSCDRPGNGQGTGLQQGWAVGVLLLLQEQ